MQSLLVRDLLQEENYSRANDAIDIQWMYIQLIFIYIKYLFISIYQSIKSFFATISRIEQGGTHKMHFLSPPETKQREANYV